PSPNPRRWSAASSSSIVVPRRRPSRSRTSAPRRSTPASRYARSAPATSGERRNPHVPIDGGSKGEASMKLHVFPPSPNAIKVLATAHHLELPFELVLVDLLKGGQKSPAFTAINPNQKMPVLEDDGFTLWESNAITQYLASKKPERGLWPTEPGR